ncbi:DUF6338 family protein [Brevibacillus borstelensis]|uniref:DUF6338 family protein n=1 Tax=Brevibacillus borstelensis TaxID=45462 RepID=UPI00046A7A3B|nr:DUF6338 family protein [Brevibacillus borstelensis]
MENLIGTIIFLLPGFLAYFWLQSFGITPVTKHTPAEFTTISALLWLPVSFFTLLLYNVAIWLSVKLVQLEPIWTVADLNKVSGSFVFLIMFLLLSALVSFILCLGWIKFGHKRLQNLINRIRISRGIAPFSESPSVWDEVFVKYGGKVVEIGKIDKPEGKLIGCIRKASRPLEPERNLYLDDVQFFTMIVKNYDVPISNIFYDTKSGSYVKVFDNEAIIEAQHKYYADEATTS